MYPFFNESNQEESRIASIAGRGQVQRLGPDHPATFTLFPA
jgi:hypothetical protein